MIVAPVTMPPVPSGRERLQVARVEDGRGGHDEEDQDRDLDEHHDGVDPGALLGAAQQQEHDRQDDEDGRQVDHGPGLAAGRRDGRRSSNPKAFSRKTLRLAPQPTATAATDTPYSRSGPSR
jgi:hypothetical protein